MVSGGNRSARLFSEGFIALAFRPFMGIIGAVQSPERAGKTLILVTGAHDGNFIDEIVAKR